MLIAEELFLLSIDEKKHLPYISANHILSYSIVGGLLAELLLDEKIEERNDVVTVLSTTADHKLLEETLKMLKKKDNKKIEYWISKLHNLHRNAKKKVAYYLEKQHVLKITRKKMLGLFPTENYEIKQSIDLNEYRQKFDRVLEKIQANESLSRSEEEAFVLLSLVDVSDLLKHIYDDKYRVKEIKRQMKDMKDNLPVSKAVQATIDTITVVIMSAAVAATSSSTTS